MSKRYNNYHKHTHYSNISTLDCCVKPIDYINRAKELGHTTYFTTEHGYQGNIFEAHKLCLDNELTPIHGVEAYYVDDASIKETRENYHIILISLTNNGRRQINELISRAYTEGFYYKARIDLKGLLSLNPKDVVITTACVATRLFKGDSWKENFFLPLLKHFGDHFFLEVQNHNETIQKELNKKILTLHKDYGVKLIHGNDTHYIHTEDSKIRDRFLEAKGMHYSDESNFVLDYPDYDTIIDRYLKQGILTKEEAEAALDNTLIFDQAEPIDLDYEFKLPKIFKEDSNKHLKRILLQEYANKIANQDLSQEQIKEYKKALNYEYKIITKCSMSDYFLLDYYIVKKAVEEYDAVLTRTGRGSAVSFLTNYLLGFTQIDRLQSPIKLYPTRFMSAERILASRSLPDIDLNWMDVTPVLKASKDYLGEDGVYYMVSYKPMQESSAFRLWCKSLGMNIKEYNDIAMDLDNYREDPKWKDIIEDSKNFVGVIESIAPSPCSVLLLDQPISKEIGLVKVGDVMCCVLDGYYCDVYKYLKNDYLIVSVYSLISKTYKLIGRPIDDIPTLLANCDEKVWKLFRDGITTTINQCDSDYDKQILKKYKPTSLAEMSAYVAAIRPGFASLLNNFIERKPYSTGVQQLDDLLDDSFHYLMYQESIMTYLTWLGIEEKETYDIIKKISKKKFKQKELEELKDKLYQGWMQQVGKENGFHETWEVVEAASRYSFNASHSLSVALDALYGAYLKANYPLEYFTVALTEYTGDEVRTNNLIKELDYFGIKLRPIKFRKSKFDYVIDKENNAIYKGVESVKFLNKKVAEELYSIRDAQFDSFIDLLIRLKDFSVDSRQLEILIKLSFFSEFGEPNELLCQTLQFDKLYNKKQIKKEKMQELHLTEELVRKYAQKETDKMFTGVDSLGLLKELTSTFKYPKTTVLDKIRYEQQCLGYIQTYDPNINKRLYYVTNINVGKSIVNVDIYELYSGRTHQVRMWTSSYNKNPFCIGNILNISRVVKKNKRRPSGQVDPNTGKAVWIAVENEHEFWLEQYYISMEEEEYD